MAIGKGLGVGAQAVLMVLPVLLVDQRAMMLVVGRQQGPKCLGVARVECGEVRLGDGNGLVRRCFRARGALLCQGGPWRLCRQDQGQSAADGLGETAPGLANSRQVSRTSASPSIHAELLSLPREVALAARSALYRD